jgi:hypothetical protein
MLLATLLNILLMLVATPGMIAPAETATNPAISAYSIKSCPWLSAQILSCHIRPITLFIRLLQYKLSIKLSPLKSVAPIRLTA